MKLTDKQKQLSVLSNALGLLEYEKYKDRNAAVVSYDSLDVVLALRALKYLESMIKENK